MRPRELQEITVADVLFVSPTPPLADFVEPPREPAIFASIASPDLLVVVAHKVPALLPSFWTV
jgi:hypothetical protein